MTLHRWPAWAALALICAGLLAPLAAGAAHAQTDPCRSRKC